MKILVHVGHPAQVHFFKHFMWDMEKRGHEVSICASDKDITLRLLDAYGFQYEKVGHHQGNLLAKMATVLPTDWRVYKVARRFAPDVILGFGSINASHAAALSGKPCILFDDDEYSAWSTYFFARTVCTFHNFKKDLGRKQVILNGFKELAYLHPSLFTPDPSVLNELGLKQSDKFVIMRFVGWQASHDVGQFGLDMMAKRELIKEIEPFARVLITSERPLPDGFKKYKISIAPERIHDLLHYATMLIGDTQTMTTEAGLLGTPAIRCNSFVGPDDMGNFIELENKYDLVYSFREPDKAIQKAVELIQQPDLKKKWAIKRKRLLDDKIDVTQFIVDFIENYPESFIQYKRGNNNQK